MYVYEYLKTKILYNSACQICDEKQKLSFKQLIECAEKLGKSLTHNKYGILCKTELKYRKSNLWLALCS